MTQSLLADLVAPKKLRLERDVPSSSPALESHVVRSLLGLASLTTQIELLPDSDDRTAVLADLRALRTGLFDSAVAERNQSRGEELTVAVVGDFSSGKSTFINALLGERICPVDVAPTTSAITTFRHGPELTLYERRSGRLRRISLDAYRECARHGNSCQQSREFEIVHPSPVLHNLRILDTPGFSNPDNPHDTHTTERAVVAADVLLLLMDAERGNPSAPLMAQLHKLRDAQGTPKRALLLINKADLKRSSSDRERILAVNRARLGDRFDGIGMVSALHLAEDPDLPAWQLVNTLTKRLTAAMDVRSSFDFAISGSKLTMPDGKRTFEVCFQDQVARVPARRIEGVLGRDAILRLLDKVRADRPAILRRAREAHKAEVREKWLGVIQRTEHYLSSQASGACAHELATDLAAIDEGVGEFQRHLEALLIERLDTVTFSFLLRRRKRVEEGFIFDTTYYTPAPRTREFRDWIVRDIQRHAEVINDSLRRRLEGLAPVSGFGLEVLTEPLAHELATSYPVDTPDEGSESWMLESDFEKWESAKHRTLFERHREVASRFSGTVAARLRDDARVHVAQQWGMKSKMRGQVGQALVLARSLGRPQF